MKALLVSRFSHICGVAEYSRFLYDAFLKNNYDIDYAYISLSQDNPIVKNYKLYNWKEVNLKNYNVVHIQFHPGMSEYYNDELKSFLMLAKNSECKIVVTIHGTWTLDRFVKDLLPFVDIYIYHQYLQDSILQFPESKIRIVYQGCFADYPEYDITKEKELMGYSPNDFVIGTFGSIVKHKTTENIIDAMEKLDLIGIKSNLIISGKVLDDSFDYLLKRADLLKINRNRIKQVYDIDIQKARKLLLCCDCLAFTMSSLAVDVSASIRCVLDFNKPIIVSDSPYYAELRDVCLRCSTILNDSLILGLDKLIWLVYEKRQNILNHHLVCLNNHIKNKISWDCVSKRTWKIYEDILS